MGFKEVSTEMKYILFYLLLLFSISVNAVGPGCKIAWDYTKTDEAKISGFPIEVNGKWVKLVMASARIVECSELPLVEGPVVFRIRARSLDGTKFSDWAELKFTYEIPIAVPQNLRIVTDVGSTEAPL
jgi:hypothetical protein